MRTILCPRASGVLSALGLAAAERRATEQRTVLLAGGALSDAALCRARDELAETATATLGGTRETRRAVAYDVRYRGQAHELTVRDLADPSVAELRAAFEDLHEERYGYRDADAAIEVVTIRVMASEPGPELDLAAADAEATERTRRAVIFDGERHDAEIVRGEPKPGERIAGPAICELPEATLAIPPSWNATVDDAGTLVMQRRG